MRFPGAIIFIYQLIISTSHVRGKPLDKDGSSDACRPMGDDEFDRGDVNVDDIDFDYRLFSYANSSQIQVHIEAEDLQRVFIQVRTSSSITAPLSGWWLDRDLPVGHRVTACEGQDRSTATSFQYDSKEVVFKWTGECTTGVTFFIYVSYSDSSWQHIRVPCTNSTSMTANVPLTIDGYGHWSRFGPCSQTCGEGSQIRRRACALHDGCSGSREEIKICFLQRCLPPYVDSCNDWFYHCREWLTQGRCYGDFSVWMRRFCPKSCTGCIDNLDRRVSVTSQCRDNVEYTRSCLRWASRNLCSMPLVRDKCTKSCGMC